MGVIKTFIDTNILIYAFSKNDPAKKEIAVDCIKNCIPVISTQVIKEFSSVSNKSNVELPDLRFIIKDLISLTEIVDEDLGLIFAAFDICERYQFSFYDSLIIAAALKSECKVLLSEDMQDGQIINESLKIVNPVKGAIT